MPKKKVLVDVRMMYASGIGVYIRNLVSRLRKEHIFIIDLLVPKNYQGEYGNDNIIKTSTPIYSAREIFLLPFLSSGYDLVWSPHYNVPFFTFRVKKRLATIHDTFHLAHFSSLTFFQKMYAKLFLLRAAKASQRIITVSEFSKRQLMLYTKVSEEKIAVIHNGVARTFAEGDINAKVAAKYSLPKEYILFVGNIKPHKNLSNLVKAFQELSAKSSNPHKLVVVGERDKLITGDPTIAQLIDKFELNEEVIFTGYVQEDDLASIYSCASLLVFPSLYEGFGLPVLEAFLSNTPVIASDIPPVLEVAGDAALYFDPRDHRDIYEKMTSVLSNPILGDELREKGRQRSLKFSWQKSYEEHLKLIKSLIKD